MAEPRIAASLDTLRLQLNTAFPRRNKTSDGWIGDEAHRARKSDHNPDSKGIVRALDVTHDADHQGDDFDSWKFSEVLRANKDPRIKYVISNGKIFYTSGKTPWSWQPYNGTNKHAHHIHISVVGDDTLADDRRPWVIDTLPAGAVMAPKPTPLPPPSGITLSMRQQMAARIVEYEARVDPKGHVIMYRAADGSREVAGINETYFKSVIDRLLPLVDAGNDAEVRKQAGQFILDYTKLATGWVTDAGLEFYLRDCCFNRGRDGATRMLQMALGFTGRDVDGEVGPATRQRLASTKAGDLLLALRKARETYENMKFGPRPNLRKGLENRWNKALADAQKFQAEGSPSATPGTKAATTAGTVLVPTAGAAKAASEGVETHVVVALLIIGFCGGLLLWKFWPRKQRESLT
jgi:hypothetical protein